MRTILLKAVAVAGMIFAASAFAQEAGTAHVPFRVNVNATVTAAQQGGDGVSVSMPVTANVEKILVVTLIDKRLE